MGVEIVWTNLAAAIADMQTEEGDHALKLATVMAGVELLFEFSAADILDQVEGAVLPVRALVSWLVYEGNRLEGVDPDRVAELRALYEATCPPGQGIIPPPPSR